jgi:hypothetical protein
MAGDLIKTDRPKPISAKVRAAIDAMAPPGVIGPQPARFRFAIPGEPSADRAKRSVMSDPQTSAILGLKRELKSTRAAARELKGQNERWRRVCATLRSLADLDDGQFRNLLKAESLPLE